MEELTRKQKGFVNDYLATGNGTQSALKNYDIQSSKPERVASVIAVENLAKPSIQKAIAERLPDDLLEQRHLELLNKREVIYTRTVAGEVGEMIDQPDTQAVSKALDMAYKLKGSYAPEKNVTMNIPIPLDDLREDHSVPKDKETQ